MKVDSMHQTISVRTSGQGLYEITEQVRRSIDSAANENESDGLVIVFIQHTSASLVIQENADPTAKADLERWMKKHVPMNNPDFTHTFEGPDDMPSHIKSALTHTSLSIPLIGGELGLGTWQGIYVWEHRDAPHTRRVTVSTLVR